MAIKLSALPPDLQRLVLQQAGAGAPVRRPRTAAKRTRLPKSCPCGFEMYRPDGRYPDRCDGCGSAWPAE
jgi:hypothetical protein